MITATRSHARWSVRLRRPSVDGWAVIGLLLSFLLVFVALFGERIAPYEPIYYVVEHGKDPRPYDPGVVFAFGSDVLGRDMFSIVLAGARTTLTVVLCAGLARVAGGLAIAALGSLIRPVRVAIETVADLAAAVPATLIAVLLIKAFVRGDTSIPIVVAALLVVGWAGPYRVLRAETDRLSRMPFTEGARVIGVGRSRLFVRHHVPHLVPILATNLSQQIVASLVLLAELGVLGVIVSAVRSIDVTESLSVVRTGPPNQAAIPDSAEWGAMLSSARTVEILWATRWVIFVPGAAFAVTAAMIAVIGYAIARRYARRDVFADLRRLGLIPAAVALLVVMSTLVPERYAGAREWASAARSSVMSATDTTADLAAAGLAVHPVVRRHTVISRSGPATLSVDGRSVAEPFPQVKFKQGADAPAEHAEVHLRSLVSADIGGGGTVEAPLVFAARGIVPPESQLPPVIFSFGKPPLDVNRYIKDYPDDYANIDVRDKIAVLVRFSGIDDGPRGIAQGFSGGEAIAKAIARGAAGVIMVDPAVGLPNEPADARRPLEMPNPYAVLEAEFPTASTTAIPVMVIDRAVADELFAPLGVDVASLLQYDRAGAPPSRSPARDLGVTARISVPLRADTTSVTSVVAEVPGFAAADGRVVVWMEHGRDTPEVDARRRDVIASLARFAEQRRAPFMFVDYDPSLDAAAIRDFLAERRVLVVFVLDQLERTTLRFTTANGDLIPALDMYADKAGTHHELTRTTVPLQAVGSPVPQYKTVVITTGGDKFDPRGDVLALFGYLAGRRAFGAPELGQ